MSSEPTRSTGAAASPLYFPTLDGLRFFAFLMVFVHHLPKLDVPVLGLINEQGWVGVHVFLFLSAFLLSSILKAEFVATGAVNLKRFLIRRVLRIWPLYFAFIVVACSYELVRHGWSDQLPLRVAGMLLFVDNVVSGVAGYNPIPYVGHLWTISLEEQFYLLLPFVLSGALLLTTTLRKRLLILWALFLFARLMSAFFAIPHPWTWTALFSADSLLLGTYFGAARERASQVWSSVPVFLLGTCLLFVGAVFPDVRLPGFHFVPLYTLVSLGAGVWTMAALNARWLRWLGVPPLRYLGKISYGLYVFHLAGIAIGSKVAAAFAGAWWVEFALSLMATITISAISYELFEKRFVSLKRRFEAVPTRPA